MGRVLVVDDDRAIRELLHVVMEMEGHQVATAANGEEALAFLTAAELPWVVVMDVMMPRLSGVEVCGRLLDQADAAAVRHTVVLMTAGLLEDIDRPAAARFIIRKPFDVEWVARLVSTLVEQIATSEVAAACAAPPEAALAASA